MDRVISWIAISILVFCVKEIDLLWYNFYFSYSQFEFWVELHQQKLIVFQFWLRILETFFKLWLFKKKCERFSNLN